MRNIFVSLSSFIFLILIISSCTLRGEASGDYCAGDDDCVRIRPCGIGTISVCQANGKCSCIHFSNEAADCTLLGSCSNSLN
ncbi:hypothetical protein LINGRAHAP2_LOCUS16688 [Linum grandiflorum]